MPLIVDNTFPTPINCRPFEWGADIIVHSTTKYMDGHATSVGGCIVDSGNFDWDAYADKFPGLCTPDESYHGLTYTKAFGKGAYITKATAQQMCIRDRLMSIRELLSFLPQNNMDETKDVYKRQRVYWEWLSSFRFDPDKIDIHLDTTGRLHIEVSDFLYKVTLYEVPLLAIVSEIKNKFFGNVPDMSEILCKLSEKVELSNQHQLRFSEFGTRRRFSIDVQETVIKRLNDTAKYCTGTSNCYFAMKYGMKMMGTHPHEWFMFHGAQFGYKHANYMALENWVNVYDLSLIHI